MKQNYNLEKGYLKVNEIHEIYYEVCGVGEPYLFVHGGPGAGFSEKDKRFFDFEKHKVVFFDQRGASKSKPFTSIEQNTTQDLVDDINLLLSYLKIERINIFGGSWGTALSLVFAIQNPEKVKSLLLRGLFLANKTTIDHFVGGGLKKEYPKEWNRFINNVPANSTLTISAYYLDQMLNGTLENKEFYCYEWAYYEISIFKKGIQENEIDTILKEFPYYSLSIMEAHYLSNNCFLEDNYILNNCKVLETIPTIIIHGKNDAICPVEYTEEFHRHLENSTLYIEDAGHSDSEPEIEKRIITVLND
ncbi:prolyl aminopeptidase [Flavobacterium pectinovorum]|uniref:prolyl aminopeptidase n=1 Tax=Flavobacterium pectinovorum TaxID=29533 RepID=UPI001375B725|nr:prolyl aminopeptidase [Flavobacterium pectinovorum]